MVQGERTGGAGEAGDRERVETNETASRRSVKGVFDRVVEFGINSRAKLKWTGNFSAAFRRDLPFVAERGRTRVPGDRSSN